MLNLLNDYVATLNTEIASYESLIAKKRTELEQLREIQVQVVQALGVLKEVVTNLQHRDPNAIAMIKEAAHRIFEDIPSATITDSPNRGDNLNSAIPEVTESLEAPTPSHTEDIRQLGDSPTISSEEQSEASLLESETTTQGEELEPEYDPDRVRIVTERFNGAFNGLVGKVTKRSNLGAHVQLPSNEEKFFLDHELEKNFDEIPF